MGYEKKYDEQVDKINKLREELRKDPENEILKAEIKMEEDVLFRYVMDSSKIFDQLIKNDHELEGGWEE